MDSPLSSSSVPMSPLMTPNRRQRQQRERIKLFSQISLLKTTLESKIETILKVDDCPQVDDSSLILLSLPSGPTVSTSAPIDHSFHSFCITSQTGQRIYGGSYVFGHKNVLNFGHKSADSETSGQSAVDTDPGVVYTTRALVALTVRPVVDQLRKCLEWCVLRADCNPRWIRCIAQIRLPPKGKCIQISLPELRPKSLRQKRTQEDSQLKPISETTDQSPNNNNRQDSVSEPSAQPKTDNQIIIFRPLSTLPLFDYPLRRLFTEILSVDQFLTAYTCALNETQILIIGSNYYTLMLVAESLCALLNPFKWQHVYVPILPNKLGVHYLDAPTPYIMGIIKSSSLMASNLMVGCLIDCDQNSVQVNVESNLLLIPPFIDGLKQELDSLLNSDLRLSGSAVMAPQSAALKRMTDLAKKHNVINESFGYLDDLKLNQQIRVTFLKTIRKHILNKYQQFIITSSNKKDSIRFDAVSYLSDQPQSIQPFLQNFCETQMFVSFIDETAKQLVRKQKTIISQRSEQTMYESIYDDDFEDLDLSLFTDVILESRFNSAKQIDLEDLEQIPTLEMNSLCPDSTQLAISAVATAVVASPRTRRRFQTLSDKNLAKDLTLGSVLASPSRTVPAALTAQTNWRVVETLMREVKIKTKRILLEKMGTEEVGPLGCGTVGGVEENTLIAALCDLIERIWSHARSDDNKDMNRWQSGKCSFWSHLMAYYQLETNDAIDANSHKAIDSSQLTPALSQISIDSSSSTSQSTPSSPAKQMNGNPMKQLPTTLVYDIRSVRSMADIKTDVGKSRAFIRLALERKLLSKHLRTLLINHELLLTLYKRYAFLRCEEEREQFLTHLLTLNAVDLMCFTNTFTTSVLPYTLIIYGSTQMNGWFSITGSIASTSDNYIINSKNYYTFKHRNLGVLNTLTVCVNQTNKIYIEYCFVRNEVTNHIYKFHCNRWFGRNIDDGSTERVLIGELLTGVSISDILKKSNPNPTRSSSIGRNWSRSAEQYNKELVFSVEELQTMFGENVNQIMKYYFNAQNAANNSCNTGANSTGSSHNNNSHELIDLRQTNGRKVSPKVINLKNSYRNRTQTHCQTVGKRHGTDRSVQNTGGYTAGAGKSLINLIFGERKLLWILGQIFYYGFKNRSKSSFRKQWYLWDYMLRIVCELKISRTTHKTIDSNEELFIDLIDSITNNAPNYGKDSKFALFLLVSIRDHHLSPTFLQVLSRPSLSHLYYESDSFIRDITLITFLYQILNTFNDIELTFEPSLTKGL